MFCQRDGFEQLGKFRYFDEIGCFIKEMVFVEFGCFVNETVLNSYGNLDIEFGCFVKAMVLNSFGNIDILTNLDVLSKRWF